MSKTRPLKIVRVGRNLNFKNMAWDRKYSDYGVIKIEGERVILYCNSFTRTSLNVGKKVLSAHWSGTDLIVNLADGKVRKYPNDFTFSTI